MNYTDLATTVTQQLVAQIETGPRTWRMPWHTVPGVFDVRNASTGNRYHWRLWCIRTLSMPSRHRARRSVLNA